MYNMGLFRYRAPGLPLEAHTAKAVCASSLRYIHCKHERMVPWPQAAQGHTPTLLLDPPLKNGTFVESSLWDWLVVAVILHQG